MADRTDPRRRTDAFGVLMGLLFLVIASVGLSGSIWWLLSGQWKWMAAGAVALVGLAMVVSSLPGRRRP